MAVGRASRPYHVYDHEGDHLGSFTAWETAHEWAHLQVALSALPAPLEVEDRRRRTRRQVWVDHCAPFPTPATEATGSPGTDPGTPLAASAFAFAPPHPRGPS
ncbi:hypothetical protein [Pseudofrankia saprophytica]|uniref:hypothetical protein n=1 Tax=Pseudofrankia saprophytica TaxID=298655 RepID=UPI0002DC4513|nr:hypothetical protein [Pseudofrankia saprophytica]